MYPGNRFGSKSRLALLVLLVGLFPALSGCGKPPMIAVTGTVKINGKAVPNCKVALVPDLADFDPNKHGVGYGITDAEGKFEIQHPQGAKGIYPGNYKVTFLAWVDGKGKPLPADIKPSEVEGGAKNLFPMEYESISTTPERLSVGKQPVSRDFDIAVK